MKELTQKYLRCLFSYDEAGGNLIRSISRSNFVKVGDKAGCLDKITGYIKISIDGKDYQAHRLIWLHVYGVWPKYNIDHINHDRADNRILNLRTVKQQENLKNLSFSKLNTSGITGVYWSKAVNKWLAQIYVNKKAVYLGCFTDKFEAICARMSANIKYGYHENHGK